MVAVRFMSSNVYDPMSSTAPQTRKRNGCPFSRGKLLLHMSLCVRACVCERVCVPLIICILAPDWCHTTSGTGKSNHNCTGRSGFQAREMGLLSDKYICEWNHLNRIHRCGVILSWISIYCPQSKLAYSLFTVISLLSSSLAELKKRKRRRRLKPSLSKSTGRESTA